MKVKKMNKSIEAIKAIILIIIICSFLIYNKLDKNKLDNTIKQLEIQLSKKDETIRDLNGVISKYAIEVENVDSILDGSDKVQKKIIDSKKKDEEIKSIQQVSVRLKKKYVSDLFKNDEVIEEHVNTSTISIAKVRTKVSFIKIFDIYKISGYTLSNPAYAHIELDQTNIIKIALVISQTKNGAWKSYASSNFENLYMEFDINAVSPYINEKEWYENIYVGFVLSSTEYDKINVISPGVSIGYKFNSFLFDLSYLNNFNNYNSIHGRMLFFYGK